METQIKKTRKQHIYAEAASLFRDKGYQATSMRDLAESVGLEPSSLYSHIKSKEELLRKICFDCGVRFLDEIEMITRSNIEPAEAIRALVHLHVTVAFEDITAITVFNDEWRHLTEPDLAKFLEMRREYEESCISIFEMGIRMRLFRQVDPRLALNTLLSAMQWVYRGKRIGHEDIDRITLEISELFLNGLNIKE